MPFDISGVSSPSDKVQLFQMGEATRGAGLKGATTENGVTSFGSLEDAEAALPDIRKREAEQGTPLDTDYIIVKNKESGRFEIHKVEQDLKALGNKDGAVVKPDLGNKHQFVELAIFDGGKDTPQTMLAPGVTKTAPKPSTPQPTTDPVTVSKDMPLNAVARVKNRPNAAVEGQQTYSAAQLKDPAVRDAFLKRCPQMPQGATVSEANTLCAVSGTVNGMLASNPQSVVDLAKALKANPNHWLAKGIDSSLLTRLASGQLSSNDVQALALALHRSMKQQPGARPNDGNNAGSIMSLVGGMKELGVNVPKLQLVRCSDVTGQNKFGHWMVVAPDAKPPVGINTWPNTKGEAEVFSGPNAAKDLHKRSKSAGATYRTTEVVTVQNGGDQCQLDIYSMKPAGQQYSDTTDAEASQKPLATATYKRNASDSRLFDRKALTYNNTGVASAKAVEEAVKPPQTVGLGSGD